MDARTAADSRRWYHALELAPGVVTDGWFDLRGDIHHYGIPEDLTGKRCLDIGTWDGFWAFELERRGAEVVALDLDDERELDWPPRRRPAEHEMTQEPRGAGFQIAKELRGSSVERVVRSIYHATPEELGTFDLVFCGSVLIHLRDQLLALERIRNLVKPGGTFISAEEYDKRGRFLPWQSARYLADRDSAVVFWMPTLKTWKAMHWTAGFDATTVPARFTMYAGKGKERFGVPHAVIHSTVQS